MLHGILLLPLRRSTDIETSSNLAGENISLLENESMINTDLASMNQDNLIVLSTVPTVFSEMMS